MIIKWWKKRQYIKANRKAALEAALKIQKESEKEKADAEYLKRGDELKETLTKAGVFTFGRGNRNCSAEYVEMYGHLHNRLVKGTMSLRGAFMVEYVDGGGK